MTTTEGSETAAPTTTLPPTTRHITDLPTEIFLHHILPLLDFKELFRFTSTCRSILSKSELEFERAYKRSTRMCKHPLSGRNKKTSRAALGKNLKTHIRDCKYDMCFDCGVCYEWDEGLFQKCAGCDKYGCRNCGVISHCLKCDLWYHDACCRENERKCPSCEWFKCPDCRHGYHDPFDNDFEDYLYRERPCWCGKHSGMSFCGRCKTGYCRDHRDFDVCEHCSRKLCRSCYSRFLEELESDELHTVYRSGDETDSSADSL